MTYNTIATMAEDEALTRRVTAAVASEGILDPAGWLYPRIWQVASQPGWAGAWESAVAAGITDPGANEGVITDGMILSGVQSIIASENPPPAVDPGPDGNPEPQPVTEGDTP
jgi:hypothetical protein